MAFVSGLFVVVTALLGTLGLAAAGSDSRALQAQSVSRGRLDAVVAAAAQAQLEASALSRQAPNAQGLASVTKLNQTLVDDWEHYLQTPKELVEPQLMS